MGTLKKELEFIILPFLAGGICVLRYGSFVISMIFSWFTFLLKLFRDPLPWIWIQNCLIKAQWKGKSERRKRREQLQQMLLGQSLKLVGLLRIMKFSCMLEKLDWCWKQCRNSERYYFLYNGFLNDFYKILLFMRYWTYQQSNWTSM